MRLIIDIPEDEYNSGTLVNYFGCYSEKLNEVIYNAPTVEMAEDCICRKELRKLICQHNDKYGYSDTFHEFTEKCLHLPSVTPQPKRGKWIEVEAHNCHATLKCSECDRVIEPTYTFGEYSYEAIKKFYPYCHCGARMAESEE